MSNVLKFPEQKWDAVEVLRTLLEWAERGDFDKLLVVYARTENDSTRIEYASSKMDSRDRLMLAAFAEQKIRQKLIGSV